MSQRHLTTTNQFSTVIDALELGKKTGVLNVERGEGETFEEGTITLINGQVVNASIGRYKGRDAATKLFSWQACRFSFDPLPPENVLPSQETSPLPTAQTGALTVNKHLQEAFYGDQQMNLAVQGNLSRRPVSTVYSPGSLDNILLTLDRQGFSRAHRHLFLLIDGRRSVEELAALIRRTPNETLTLLANLEQAGFIRL